MRRVRATCGAVTAGRGTDRLAPARRDVHQGAVPVPSNVTETGFSLKSSHGITRRALCGPTLLGANLTTTVHVCVGESVCPEQKSLPAGFLNWSGFVPSSVMIPNVNSVVPSLRTVTFRGDFVPMITGP